MDAKKFKMEKKPQKPTKDTLQGTIEVISEYSESVNLSEALSQLPENIDLSDCTLELNSKGDYDHSVLYSVHISWEREYNDLLKQYDKDMETYNEWYKKNKNEIEQINSKKKEIKKQKIQSTLEKEKVYLTREKERMEKKLKKLEKQAKVSISE